MKIWIDLANSPQVLFFRPLIPEFEKCGHEVAITTRSFAQTIDLANFFRMKHIPIGEHGGKKLGKIGLAVLNRAWGLVKYAKGRKFDLAISHNSYAQALAAKIMGIPLVTSMDYEYQPANHICFRFAKKVIVPEFFPLQDIKRYGAYKKYLRYHGTKEEIYLYDFIPQKDYFESIGVPRGKIVAVMRPPGSWGLYHHFENPLFEKALEHVAKKPDTYVIFLPRVEEQKEIAKRLDYPNIFVPNHALDGPNLLYHADFVVSGGGSMNREAAVLGTPTYSMFKGRLAAVDNYLIERGRMVHIDSENGINNIHISKKANSHKMKNHNNLIDEVVGLFLSN
ncbi:MAG: DUF354 domain-containing protein [Proteobacteria bacterium]|nr:DUF354 domain-containing protein [Pseudomonadota bacterium]